MKQAFCAMITAVCFIASYTPASRAATDVGTDIPPLDSAQPNQKSKKMKPIDPFCRTLARYFEKNDDEIAKLYFRGYGRNELIKLLLISRKTGKDLREIVRLRDRKTKLSEIAGKFDIPYPALLSEAESVRRDIDFRVPVSTAAGTFDTRTSTQGIIISPSPETPEKP